MIVYLKLTVVKYIISYKVLKGDNYDMYINKQKDLTTELTILKYEDKLKLIKHELEDLKRRISCDISYVNAKNPITIDSLAEDVNNQLEEIISFI